MYKNPHGLSCPWYSLAESQGAPNIKWCEETLCQWVSEPANTWSNLGYLFIGLFITFLALKNEKTTELKQFGPIIFIMGAMSFFYHQSNFYGSQILDFVGMFFFVGWALGMNLIRLRLLLRRRLPVFYTGLTVFLTVLLHLMYLNELKFQVIILVMGLVIVGTEVALYLRQKKHIFWFGVSVLILIAAFGFSVVDGQRVWCDPTSHGWFHQGHALWHWLAGLAMFTIYLHYSEQEKHGRDNDSRHESHH